MASTIQDLVLDIAAKGRNLAGVQHCTQLQELQLSAPVSDSEVDQLRGHPSLHLLRVTGADPAEVDRLRRKLPQLDVQRPPLGPPLERHPVALFRLPGLYLGNRTTVAASSTSSTTSRTDARLHSTINCSRCSPSGSHAARTAAANSLRRVLAPASLASATSWSSRRSAGSGQEIPAALVIALCAL